MYLALGSGTLANVNPESLDLGTVCVISRERDMVTRTSIATIASTRKWRPRKQRPRLLSSPARVWPVCDRAGLAGGRLLINEAGQGRGKKDARNLGRAGEMELSIPRRGRALAISAQSGRVSALQPITRLDWLVCLSLPAFFFLSGCHLSRHSDWLEISGSCLLRCAGLKPEPVFG